MPRWCARPTRMRASSAIDHERRQGDAGRAWRLHRRRLCGRQARADPARSGAEDQIRHEAAWARRQARCSSVRTCFCPPTRCGMSAKRWRWWSPKPRRRRMDAAEAVEVHYEELPFVLHSRRRHAAGRARGLGSRCRTTCLVETFFGDREATDRAFAARRACCEDEIPHRPRHRRADGAALRAWRITMPRRTATCSMPARAARCGRRTN